MKLAYDNGFNLWICSCRSLTHCGSQCKSYKNLLLKQTSLFTVASKHFSAEHTKNKHNNEIKPSRYMQVQVKTRHQVKKTKLKVTYRQKNCQKDELSEKKSIRGAKVTFNGGRNHYGSVSEESSSLVSVTVLDRRLCPVRLWSRCCTLITAPPSSLLRSLNLKAKSSLEESAWQKILPLTWSSSPEWWRKAEGDMLLSGSLKLEFPFPLLFLLVAMAKAVRVDGIMGHLR